MWYNLTGWVYSLTDVTDSEAPIYLPVRSLSGFPCHSELCGSSLSSAFPSSTAKTWAPSFGPIQPSGFCTSALAWWTYTMGVHPEVTHHPDGVIGNVGLQPEVSCRHIVPFCPLPSSTAAATLQHALQAPAHSHTSLPETALPPASKRKAIPDMVSFGVPIFLKMYPLTLCWPS